MFSQTTAYYDQIYSWKDYCTEAEDLTDVIHENLRSGGKRLLDVACGTGRHVEYLKQHFDVEGLDVSQEMLELAQQRNPDVSFHHADMIDFELGNKFDVVTCLFSSIGYVGTVENLIQAVNCMTRHLHPGGVLVIEPWLTPDVYQPGRVHANFVDEPDLKIARISTGRVEGRLSVLDMHYLIGTPGNVTHLVECHQLAMFENEEMHEVLANAGLEVSYDAEGLMLRGLFIGRRKG